MAEAPPERAGGILTKWLKEIQRRGQGLREKKKPMEAIHDELGQIIGLSGSTIESWRWGKRRPPIDQAVAVAIEVVRRLKTVEKDDFFEFLSGFNHPSPSVVWEELFSSWKVDFLPQVEHFTGREAKLDELFTIVKPGQVVSLVGPGGVGKSAMVAEFIRQLAPNNYPPTLFPHGIFYHDFYKQPSAAAALEQMYRYFAKDEPPSPTPRDAARRALANKLALIIFDGAEDADDLRTVLNVRGKCGVLIVTRNQLVVQGKPVTLDVLPLHEAIAVLQAWSSPKQERTEFQVWTSDEDANHGVAKEICELVGRLPLALRLAGRYMNQTKTTALRFRDLLQESGISLLQEERRQHQSIPVLLKHSIDQANEGASDTLGVIGLLSYHTFATEVIATGLGQSHNWTQICLNELVRFSLLRRDLGDRYQVVHRLVHTYAKKMSAPHEAVDRLAKYYTTFAKEQSKLEASGYQRLDTERPHILAVVTECAEQNHGDNIWQLIEAVDQYLDLQGYWIERVSTLTAGLKAVRSIRNEKAEAQILNSLGEVYADLGEPTKTLEYYVQALELYRQLGDQVGEAGVLSNIGMDHVDRGELITALNYYQQALLLQRQASDREGEGITLNNIGYAYAKLNEETIALNYYQQGLLVAREGGDHRGVADSLNNIGRIYDRQGEKNKALDYYQQVLEIDQKIGDRKGEAITLNNIGKIYTDLRDSDKALAYLEQALSLRRAISDHRGEAGTLSNLGKLYDNLGEKTKAFDQYQKALELFELISDRHAERDTLGRLGDIYYALGQYEKAVEYYALALVVEREIGDSHNEAIWLSKLDDARHGLKRLEGA